MAERNLTPFFFEEDTTVRVIVRDGVPEFVAADVCRALKITNVSQAIRQLDDDEKGICSTYTLGGEQKVLVISESGLFTLILRCRDAVKPGTLPHRFRRWVTSEVLPTVRLARQAAGPSGDSNGNGSVLPETVALRMVRVAHGVWGNRAAREMWVVTGLPITPSMRLASPQLDLFALAAQQAQPSVEMHG